jgi:hypothetical protein
MARSPSKKRGPKRRATPAAPQLSHATWAEAAFEASEGARRNGANELKEVLFARSAYALLALVREMPESVVRAALTAPTAIGSMARLVAEGAVLAPGAQAADPLAASYARSAERKRRVIERAGGEIGATEVGTLLGISRQAVDKRRSEGKLLAIRSPSGDYRYPSVQFTADGNVVPHLAKWLAGCGWDDEWMQLQLLTSKARTLGGRTVFDALASGDDALVTEAMRLAETAGEQGG